MYIHPEHAAMVGRQRHREMLAAAEQLRLFRQAALLSPVNPRRSRLSLALARARRHSGAVKPGPVSAMPSA
jgi:hypothetical protein